MDELTVLALRSKGGSRAALEHFIAVTRPDVVRLCGLLGHPADPEDLAQETFERAIGSIHRYRADAPAKAWLFSIARRVCADSARRMARRRRLDERIDAVKLCEPVHHDQSWLEVAEILGSLDPDRRDAFVLTQFFGMSYDEAAHTLGCPVGTIRSRVARARSQLLDRPWVISETA